MRGAFTQDHYLGLAKAVGEHTRWAGGCADEYGQVDECPDGFCSWNPTGPVIYILKKNYRKPLNEKLCLSP